MCRRSLLLYVNLCICFGVLFSTANSFVRTAMHRWAAPPFRECGVKFTRSAREIFYPTLSLYVGFIKWKKWIKLLEKVAIAMHCNLRPSDVATELWALITRRTHSTSAYKFNNSATVQTHNAAPTHQISAKSNNPRRSYCHLIYVQFGRHWPSWIWPEVDFN